MSDVEDLETEKRRLILVGNERRRLLAGALDRLSTAFMVVGVLGPILSLGPMSANFITISMMLSWILGAVIHI